MSCIRSYLIVNDFSANELFRTNIGTTYTVGTKESFIITVIFFCVICIQFVLYLLKDGPPRGSGLKLVPGPWSTIPYVGRIHDVDRMAPWFAMKRFSDQYNGLFRLTIGGDMHIWVGDPKIANDLLCKRAAIYSSRPMMPAVPGSDSQGQYLPLLEHGSELWEQVFPLVNQRLTLIQHTGVGSDDLPTPSCHSQNKNYYGCIHLEVKRYLFKLLMDPLDHFALTDGLCGRISARLCYGSPASASAHCKNAAEFIPEISPAGPITNLLPILGTLPEFLNPSIKNVRLRREREEILWNGLLQQVRDDMDTGTAPISFARTYFERKKAMNQNGSVDFGFDETEAAYAVGMLCTVAIFTVAGPLYCFILVLVLFPEWQDRVRKEVDEAVGDRVAELSDSPKLPILRAVIKECLRWRPLVPLGVPRLLEEDDTYNGYFIPKGAVIHAIDLALSRDPNLYPDPEAFRPERWLEPKYPTYKWPLTEYPRLVGHHGFGMGRRVCPGIDISEAELLIACSALAWAFNFNPNLDENGQPAWPDRNAFTSNVIGGPLPFSFDLQVRDEKRRARIVDMYEKSVVAEAANDRLS